MGPDTLGNLSDAVSRKFLSATTTPLPPYPFLLPQIFKRKKTTPSEVMICCSFCLYTLECWVFKTAHWIFKTGFYPCNGDEKLKKGENGGNLTLCWSANLELVANLLGSQSIWGNQMGGPEIRILERDRPKLDQISWNRNLNWRNSSSEAVLRKKVLQTKNQCVPWFDQWVSSSTEGLFLIQYLDEVTIEKSRKKSG